MARIGKINSLFLFILLLAKPALAGVLTGELDHSGGSLDDQFLYTLSVQGSFSGNPEFPVIDGLDIQASGRSQSVSVVNGQMSSETQFQFTITAQKVGTYTIPPVKLTVDKKPMETLPLELKVVASGAPRPSAGATGGAAASDDGQQGGGIRIERTFSKSKVYVGESIGVKVRVLIPMQTKVVGAQPDFKYPSSLQVKQIEKQKTYTEEVGGETYGVTELDAVVIPSREGEYTIDPAMLEVRIAVPRRSRSRGFFDDFMTPTDVRERRLRSAPAVLKVLPLPTEGRRRDFSGLIGEFALQGDLNPRSGTVGDTLNLKLTVSGKGSAAAMAEPSLPFDAKLAKVYKDKPEYQEVVDSEHGVQSQKTFNFAIVPSRAGNYGLGTISLQTFNPETGRYQDLNYDLGEVSIQGGNGVAQAVPPAAAKSQGSERPQAAEVPSRSRGEQKAVEVKAKDLIEPHPQSELRGSDILGYGDWANGAVVLGLSASGIIASLVFAIRRRPEGEAARAQVARRAFKQSRKRLDHARQCLKKQDLTQAVREAQCSFKDYAGAKFGFISAAVTLRDIETSLRSRSVSRETLLELREVWGALDQMIYAPPLGLNPSRGEELLDKSRRILEQMERQCGRS